MNISTLTTACKCKFMRVLLERFIGLVTSDLKSGLFFYSINKVFILHICFVIKAIRDRQHTFI